MDALCVIHNSRIDWSFGLCWVLRLAAFVYFHAHMKQDTQMPNMTFHIILMGVWIPFNCSRTECIHLIRADSTSDYSTRYCFNHLQMNFIRCLENGADHPNNEGFSWVGPNTIDSSWQISSPSCLRNFTQWRQIWMLQWLHVLDWPVQFTCPRIWQASPRLSKHECPMNLSDVRILHVWMTRIWPHEVWFWRSVGWNNNPQKEKSEPITYLVCFGQTDLTRISSSLHHTHVYVWHWVELHINTIAIIVISAAGGAEEGMHSPHFCPLSHQIRRVWMNALCVQSFIWWLLTRFCKALCRIPFTVYVCCWCNF